MWADYGENLAAVVHNQCNNLALGGVDNEVVKLRVSLLN